MSSTVYYNNPDLAAVLPVMTFSNASGAATNPSSVTLVLTDPNEEAYTFTYPGTSGGGSAPEGTITEVGTGQFQTTLTNLIVTGLYTFVWIGTGNGVAQVTPGTFRLMPLTDTGVGMTGWYAGMEELKSRLGIKPTDTFSDYEIQLSLQTASNWVTNYCDQHFYQVTEARTFQPSNIWQLNIDPLVSTTANTDTLQVNLDYDGDGIYEVSWTYDVNYVLKFGPSHGNTLGTYNLNSAGVPRPYKQLQVLQDVPNEATQGGGWLPFIWPYTHLDRVQIIGTWGWNTIPPAVSQATLMLAVDMFKAKDAPWGMAGVADLGVVKVQSNPWIVELLRPYINMRMKVGV